jgi:group I intron endonuclease
MIIYSIYKVVNQINGKVYIGFTSKKSPKTRWTSHLSQINNPKYCNNLLYKAIRKYGKDFFNFEVIYQSIDCNHTLNVMEPYFIKEYDSFGKFGYNLTKGGEGTFGYKRNPWNKGLKDVYSPEYRKKISESAKNRPRKIGLLHTQETKNKLSIKAKNRNYSYLNKKIETPLGIFNSFSEAAKFHGKSNAWINKNIKNHPDKFIVKQHI